MAIRLKMEKVCEGCGSLFHPYIREQKFCQWRCYLGRIARKPKPCPQCGLQFQPANRQAQFCSKECANNALKANCGPKSQFWRGGKYANGRGYTTINITTLSPEDHALAVTPNRKLSTVLEHRLVMARHLGRQLLKSEIVHHKNGVRNDNRIENLELWTTAHPAWQRKGDLKCPHCGGSIV